MLNKLVLKLFLALLKLMSMALIWGKACLTQCKKIEHRCLQLSYNAGNLSLEHCTIQITWMSLCKNSLSCLISLVQQLNAAGIADSYF